MDSKTRQTLVDLLNTIEYDEMPETFELIIDIMDWRLYKAQLCDNFYFKASPLVDTLFKATKPKQ